MAITWGPAITTSDNGARLGYELSQSPSSVGTGTSSVTVTLKLYVGTRRSVYDSTNSWSLSGDFSGSGAANISHGSSSSWSGSNVTLIATKTKAVSTSYSGTVRTDFSASLSGLNAVPGTARVSGSIYTGKRPISPPATPTNAKLARNSDTQMTVTWTNTSPTSSSNPYQKIEVDRWDIASLAYKRIATINVASSYTDKTTTVNQYYRYRMRATNSAGRSGYDYTEWSSTTPRAPYPPKATKTTAGDISLKWSMEYIRKNTGVEVWATAAGVDQGTRIAVLPENATSWVHVDPSPLTTWSYRVRTLTGSDSYDVAPNLVSSYSGRSNTIQLLTNPLAPTGLKPSSVSVDGADPIVFSWTHNEIDGTDQTAFEVQRRVVGAPSWTSSGKITSTNSTWTLPAGAYANGQSIEWQVRTYGLYPTAPAYSPWSATSIITLSTAPTTLLQAPLAGDVYTNSTLGISWSFYDAEDNPQAQWRATLKDAAGTTLEVRSGAGTATATTFARTLSDGGSYSVAVTARDSTGLWSIPDVAAFTVLYPLPPVATITGEWDPDTGTVSVVIVNGVTLAGQADAITNDLWRSINGADWKLVATGLELNSAVTDYIPAVNASNYYKVTTNSALPSIAESQPTGVATTDHQSWVWVNAGPGFSVIVRLRDNASFTAVPGREKALQKFAGRKFPVEFIGEQRSNEISFAARVTSDSSSEAEIRYLADLPAPACFRTPDGGRWFVSTGDPSLAHQGMTTELSWNFTEIDHNE